MRVRLFRVRSHDSTEDSAALIWCRSWVGRLPVVMALVVSACTDGRKAADTAQTTDTAFNVSVQATMDTSTSEGATAFADLDGALQLWATHYETAPNRLWGCSGLRQPLSLVARLEVPSGSTTVLVLPGGWSCVGVFAIDGARSSASYDGEATETIVCADMAGPYDLSKGADDDATDLTLVATCVQYNNGGGR